MMRITEALSREEIDYFNQKSDLAGLSTFLINYLLIAAAFFVVARWTNPLTILPALVLLGNRQLGLSVMEHDCGHKSLFKSPFLNRAVGRWLCAAPVFGDLDSYMAVHKVHHAKAGSDEDPDRENYRHYAVLAASFRRKIVRDLTGQTGVRNLTRAWKAGGLSSFWRPLIVNGIFLGALTALGRPELYLLWIGAYLTTFQLIARLRQAAEHAVVPDLGDPDPRRHTRTTIARWWERLTLAPNRVNYHLEHHLLPGVPPHRLPELHHTLYDRGFTRDADIAHGYGSVIRRLVRRPSEEPTTAEPAG